MQLSIVILNYKTKNLLKQCLKNIANLSLPFEHEIIVVDNNSQDGAEEMVKENFPEYKFIQADRNRGMGAGNNLGIKHSRGEYVLILNPDVVVLENSIEKLLKFIEKDKKIGCVAPQLLYPNKTYQQSRYKFPKFFMLPVFIRTGLGKFVKRALDEYFMNNIPIDQAHKIDWARGSALLIRKSVLDKIHGFDERFFMYLEDTDLCRRIWQAGYEIWYVPDAQMIHYYFRESGSGSWLKDLFKKLAWIHIASWFKYFWKWRGRSLKHFNILTF